MSVETAVSHGLTVAPPPRFPTLTLVVPLIVGVVFAVIFRSPFGLIIGVLGPVMALASWWEARKNHRLDSQAQLTRAQSEASAREATRVTADDAFRRQLSQHYPSVDQWLAQPLWRPARSQKP